MGIIFFCGHLNQSEFLSKCLSQMALDKLESVWAMAYSKLKTWKASNSKDQSFHVYHLALPHVQIYLFA